MASSGTYTFAPSNGELVLAAYERIGLRAPELRQEHMVSARRELNFLFVQWNNKSPNLWKVTRTQTTLTSGTATYSIPTNIIVILDASIVLNYGLSNESRRYITPISRTDYLSYPNQAITGFPISYWYDRLISETITFWPVPDSGGPYTFDYFSMLQIQDANLSDGETPDIPERWLDAAVSSLSHRLSRIYAPTLEAMRKADADEAWRIAAEQDTEPVPIRITPAIGSYYRR